MGGNKKGTDSLNDMAMLPFRSAILSMGTRTRELRKSTVGGEKVVKLVGKIVDAERHAEGGRSSLGGGEIAGNVKVRYRRSGPRPLEGGLKCPRDTPQEHTENFRNPWPSGMVS